MRDQERIHIKKLRTKKLASYVISENYLFECSFEIRAVLCYIAWLYPILCNPMDYSPPGSSVHGDSPASLLECVAMASFRGSYQAKRINPGLPLCRQILYHLSHKGSSRMLECVAYPFSRGSSQPRNRTGVSCIAGRFFTSWATKETLWNT